MVSRGMCLAWGMRGRWPRGGEVFDGGRGEYDGAQRSWQ